MSYKTNPKVYLDVQIGASQAGRVIFELFVDLTPKTAQNFRGLCTGEYGKVNNTKLHYLNSRFHKLCGGFAIQGGDITGSGGSGGHSIYGRTFVDENFARRHSCAGLLSMANTGRNSNSSQFMITLKAAPHLDGKHVVFGQVIDGMEIVRKMAKVPVDKMERVKIPIIVLDCGQIDDFKSFLKHDPFKKSVFEQIQKKKMDIVERQHRIRKLLEYGIEPNDMYNHKIRLDQCDEELRLLQLEEKNYLEKHPEQAPEGQQSENPNPELKPQQPQQSQISDNIKKNFKESQVQRLQDLKSRLNEAKAFNSKAVLMEEMQQSQINFYRVQKKEEWQEKKRFLQEQLKAKGISEDKLYLNRASTQKAEKDQGLFGEKKKTKQDSEFGWNIFTEQALYKAYHKRCKDHPVDTELYQKMKNDPNFVYTPGEDALNRLAEDIDKQLEQRSKFSRRRTEDETEIVTYVNERNRVYNKKLDRSFGKYSQNIRTALEMSNLKNQK